MFGYHLIWEWKQNVRKEKKVFGFGPSKAFLLVTFTWCFRLDSSLVSMPLKNDVIAWNNVDKCRGSFSVLSNWGRRNASVLRITNVRSNARLVTFMVPVFQINWLRTWPELGQQSGHDKKPEGQKQDCVIDINWYEILSVHYFRIATQYLFGGYNCAVRTLYRIKCTFFVLNPEKFGIKTYKLTLI